MVIIIAESMPDRIRGILKRWFIEPKPNVFVSHINEKVKKKVLEYINDQAQDLKYLLIYTSPKNCQHFKIENHGSETYTPITLSGLDLIGKKTQVI